ncbi:MAG: dihydroneopterin aldolase [Puniceicoccales bacterium]|jgi:dihydroneopterin aldolase|nr:dihydroneopterin aldolase [Puniceicoccales bacterium]
MDEIRINGIKIFGHHGDLPEEVRLGQMFKVSLVLGLDTGRAAEADDLSLTVDYAAVIRRVEDVVHGPSVRLVETLAERVAAAVLGGFPLVQTVSVEVGKPFAPLASFFEEVSVRIFRERTRKPASRQKASQEKTRPVHSWER